MKYLDEDIYCSTASAVTLNKNATTSITTIAIIPNTFISI